MDSMAISLIVFTCMLFGALTGMFLRVVLPHHHLSVDSKDIIKIAMGLLATMSALVLGLLIASAKNSYDEHDAAVKSSAAKVLVLDHVLSSYGAETIEIRAQLRRTLSEKIAEVWGEGGPQRTKFDVPKGQLSAPGLESRILQLAPHNDSQRWLRSQALQIIRDVMETRWAVLGSLRSSIPMPFLVIMVFWLTVIFVSFGLFAPRNATVAVVLFLCALSVASSVFLILEMDHPFEGTIKISSAPLRYALSQLGQ